MTRIAIRLTILFAIHFLTYLSFALLASQPLMAQGMASGIMVVEGGDSYCLIVVTSKEDWLVREVFDKGRRYEVRTSNEKIEVDFIETYGSDDLKRLRVEHPDLSMYAESLPRMIGDRKIGFEFSVATTKRAANAEELEKNHPEAFAIYDKYTRVEERLGIGGLF